MVKPEEMTNGEIADSLDKWADANSGGSSDYGFAMTCLEAARRLRLMDQIVAALRDHHRWQCEAEDLTMTYTDPKTGSQETLNISQEYPDSIMHAQTVDALAALEPKEQP